MAAADSRPAWLRALSDQARTLVSDKLQPAIRGGATGVAAATTHVLQKLNGGEHAPSAEPSLSAASTGATSTPVVVEVADAASATVATAASSGVGSTLVFMVILTLFLGGVLLTRWETVMDMLGSDPRSWTIPTLVDAIKAAAAPPAPSAPAGSAAPAPAPAPPPQAAKSVVVTEPADTIRATRHDLAATRGPATARTMMMEQSYVEVNGVDADFEMVSKPHAS